jgi:hypothetical protein
MIPVSVEDFLKTVNLADLDGKTKVTNLVDAHQPGVLLYLQNATTDDSYTAATDSEGTVEADIDNPFKLAYCYIMLRNIVSLLNLNTAGRGIVNATGIDDKRSELRSEKNIQIQKTDLEREALSLLQPFLSPQGKRRFAALNPNKKSKTKATLLGEDTDIQIYNWWSITTFDEDLW